MSSNPWRSGRSAFGWPLRHPFVLASVLAHAALLAGMWLAGPAAVGRASLQARRDDASINESLAQARRIQLQRRVRAIELVQRELAGTQAGAPAAELPLDPAALLERAQAATAAIEKLLEKKRAEELARLLDIPVPKALEKLHEAQAKSVAAAPEKLPPAQLIAQLEQRAQHAAASAAQRTAKAEQGVEVNASGTGAGQGSGGSSTGGGGEAGDGAGQYRDPRVYSQRAAFDAAAKAATHLATGRSFGSGGERADRIYLNRWYIAGPFEGRGRDSLQSDYPPELGVDLDAVYRGWGDRPVRWQYVSEPRYPFIPLPKRENAVYYAYTELRVDEARDVWLDIGADDDSKLWLNDRLVWTSDDGDKPWYHRPFYNLQDEMARYGLVEGTRRVHLQAGRNTLLFKLYNGIDLMFFSVVLRP